MWSVSLVVMLKGFMVKIFFSLENSKKFLLLGHILVFACRQQSCVNLTPLIRSFPELMEVSWHSPSFLFTFFFMLYSFVLKVHSFLPPLNAFFPSLINASSVLWVCVNVWEWVWVLRMEIAVIQTPLMFHWCSVYWPLLWFLSSSFPFSLSHLLSSLLSPLTLDALFLFSIGLKSFNAVHLSKTPPPSH